MRRGLATIEDVDDPDQTRLFAQLAALLKEAHARVHRIDAPAEVRNTLVHRLLQITHLARRDPADALRRLTCLLPQLDSGARHTLDGANRPNSLHHKGD